MYWPRKLTRDINIRVPPYAIIYQQRRRDLINITSYIITIRFYICALSSSSEQSTLRVFLTYSPRLNTTPSITLLSFEFTTGNKYAACRNLAVDHVRHGAMGTQERCKPNEIPDVRD